MDLPVRIVDSAAEAAVKVDGVWPGAGLELSHWPGQRTPRDLAHELSTGIALRFARLDQRERERRADGAALIANHHFDTDGVCALFAVRHPKRALELESPLLAAAAAGDFFEVRDERSLQIDCMLDALVDPERSWIHNDWAAMSSLERHQFGLAVALEELPRWLSSDLTPWRAAWERPLERWRADIQRVRRAQTSALVHLDWTVYEEREGQASAGAPGRRALCTSSGTDRVLWLSSSRQGTQARLLFSTRSWFDFQTRPYFPRPDLARLCAQLDALEGEGSDAAWAWRAEEAASPAPELWFGAAQHPRFGEHNRALGYSTLAPAQIRRAVAEALREALPEAQLAGEA